MSRRQRTVRQYRLSRFQQDDKMSQPLLTLPDPRQYHPQVSMTNMLIHNALSVQNATTEADREMWFVAIRDAMAQMLQRGELLSISVALAMVPSQDTYKIVWDALRAAAEQPDGRCAHVFALPLVLVAGSKNQATLPAAIADEDGLNALLRQHGVISSDGDVRVFGQLLHPDTVVAMDAARLYRLTRDLTTRQMVLAKPERCRHHPERRGCVPALPAGCGHPAGRRCRTRETGWHRRCLGHALDEIPG
jgi:hypothetical protein